MNDMPMRASHRSMKMPKTASDDGKNCDKGGAARSSTCTDIVPYSNFKRQRTDEYDDRTAAFETTMKGWIKDVVQTVVKDVVQTVVKDVVQTVVKDVVQTVTALFLAIARGFSHAPQSSLVSANGFSQTSFSLDFCDCARLQPCTAVIIGLCKWLQPDNLQLRAREVSASSVDVFSIACESSRPMCASASRS